jgi:hypothetical protein
MIIKSPKKIIPKVESLFTHKSRKKLVINVGKEGRGTTRQLIYSSEAKKIIFKIPGFVKAIYDLSNIETAHFTKHRLKGKVKNKPYFCTISREAVFHQDARANMYYNYNYFIEFKFDGQIKKYFGKQLNDSEVLTEGRDGFNEMLGLNYLRKIGINIVEPHFGFANGIDKKSFIFYEYMDPKIYITVDQAYEQGRLTRQNKVDLNYKLASLRDKKVVYKGKNYFFSDINTRNTFINKKTGELYIFDPWFSTMPIEKRYSQKKE